MATEHVIDLEHQRYADLVYTGPLPPSLGAEEREQAERRTAALERLREVASAWPPYDISTAQLRDLLTVMGLDG